MPKIFKHERSRIRVGDRVLCWGDGCYKFIPGDDDGPTFYGTVTRMRKCLDYRRKACIHKCKQHMVVYLEREDESEGGGDDGTWLTASCFCKIVDAL